MWDVLRRGTSQVLFSDLTEVAMTSLLWLYSNTMHQVLTVCTVRFMLALWIYAYS